MNAGVPCYLVEWYHSGLTGDVLGDIASRLGESAEELSHNQSQVHLVTMVAVPADEVVFGVFTAVSKSAVTRTCDRAGIPAQRVTTATEVEFPRAS
ncbi:hypothetical protein [Mycolicibacterium litorale]|uniref:hypothetical protein n=1 Tax=Mycolicibacterium litorale TaxID=758802 RepID=UPI00162577D9|nr:hypothetical protein [Mycolicibacterium litorale]